jgi:polysaccharide deacetylase 2 family uncharacterized protein YibQ
MASGAKQGAGRGSVRPHPPPRRTRNGARLEAAAVIGKFFLGMVSGGLLVSGGLVIGSVFLPRLPANENQPVATDAPKIEAPPAATADAGATSETAPESAAPEAATGEAAPDSAAPAVAEPSAEADASASDPAAEPAAETVTGAAPAETPEVAADPAPAAAADPTPTPEPEAQPDVAAADTAPALPEEGSAPAAEVAAPEVAEVAAPETLPQPSRPPSTTADTVAVEPEAPAAAETAVAETAPAVAADPVVEAAGEATPDTPAPEPEPAPELKPEPAAEPLPEAPAAVAEPDPVPEAAAETDPVEAPPVAEAADSEAASAPTEPDSAAETPDEPEPPVAGTPVEEVPVAPADPAPEASTDPAPEVAEATPEETVPEETVPEETAPEVSEPVPDAPAPAAEADVDPAPVMPAPVLPAPESDELPGDTAPVMPGTKPEGLPGADAEVPAPAGDNGEAEAGGSTFKPAPRLIDQGDGVIIRRAEDPATVPAAGGAAAPEDPRPIARFATAFENTEAKPTFAIVLIDDGSADLDRTGLAALPFPVNFALDPLDPATPERAAIYRAAGREVVMLVTGIATGAQPSDVEVAFQSMEQGLPEAVAVMDLVDPTFQNNRTLAAAVVPILKAQGRGLLTWDEGLNAADQVARREDLEAAVVFRDLGSAGADRAAVRRLLDRAVFKAGQDGRVSVVGTADPETVAALLEWTVEGKAATVALAPLTAVLQID